MEKKQTAVEWLMQTLEQNNIIDLDVTDSDKYYTIIEQAKEMEKEQSITDYKHGQNNGYMYRDGNGELIQAQQYYNETYGKETD